MSFPNNSSFARAEQAVANTEMNKYVEMVAARRKPQAADPVKQRDDWAHRLKQAADEAGDANLLALESDLLDLRDEILLH